MDETRGNLNSDVSLDSPLLPASALSKVRGVIWGSSEITRSVSP